MNRRFCKPLEEATATPFFALGGKALGLAKLAQAGFSVPPALVVLADGFRVALHKAKLNATLEKVQAGVRLTAIEVQELRERLSVPYELEKELDFWLSSMSSKKFAVRSSAAGEDSDESAWAGQYESFLCVSREGVADAVRRCWLEFFGPRAASYARSREINREGQAMSVIVQAMVAATKSGVAFSSAKAGRSEVILIEACYGLGTALVGGRVAPSEYLIEKATMRLLRKSEGDQRVLEQCMEDSEGIQTSSLGRRQAIILKSDERRRLAELAVAAERALGYPLDIEWAMDGTTTYFLQARPITARLELLDPTFEATQNYLKIVTRADGWRKVFESGPVPFNFAAILAKAYATTGSVFFWAPPVFLQYTPVRSAETMIKEAREVLLDKSIWSRFQHELAAGLQKLDGLITKRERPLVETIMAFSEQAVKTIATYSLLDPVRTDVVAEEIVRTPDGASLLRAIGVFKEEMREKIGRVFFAPGGSFSRLMERAAGELEVDNKLLSNLSVDELIDLTNGSLERENARERAKERELGYCLWEDGNGHLYVVVGEAIRLLIPALQISDFVDDDVQQERRVVEGLVASSAKHIARGRVWRVSVDYADLDSLGAELGTVDDNIILVAESTSPELTPAFDRAIAVITDLGGLLSHAAVTSREMGLPCIVGTRVATRVLETGQVVEVDVTQGLGSLGIAKIVGA